MKHTLLFGSLLALGLAASACQSGYKEGETPINEGRTTQVTSGNEYLAERIHIRDLRQRRGDDGRLTIEFELINTWVNRLEFQWMLHWYDAIGMQLDDGPNETLTLQPREAKTMRFTAMTPEADRFKLELQKP